MSPLRIEERKALIDLIEWYLNNMADLGIADLGELRRIILKANGKYKPDPKEVRELLQKRLRAEKEAKGIKP